MKTLTRFRQQLDALPHFVVLAASTVPPENGLKAQVRDILESPPDRIYRDGIESIDRAEIVDGAIEGEFFDRVGVRAVKRVGFRITPEEIETWILNPDKVAKFSVYQGEVLALFAPMFGKGSRAKAKKCTKGLSCGNGCIARGKKCSKAPSPETKKKIEEAIGGSGEGGAIESSSESKIHVNAIALQERRQVISDYLSNVKDLDFDPTTEIEARFQQFVDDSNIYIRVPNNNILEKIIDSGRLQNTWEVKARTNTEYLAKRKEVETQNLGIPETTENADRPIYGYFAREGNTGLDEGNYTHGYGNLAIKLKPELKNRSTVSADDTFHDVYPSSAKKVNAASFINTETFSDLKEELALGVDLPDGASVLADHLDFYAENSDKSAAWAPKMLKKMNTNYFEAQIYGGVKTSDIAEIVYTHTGKKPTPSQKVLDWANQNNINIKFEKGKKR